MVKLYTVYFGVGAYVFFAFLAISYVIMPVSSEDGGNQDMEARGAALSYPMDHLGP